MSRRVRSVNFRTIRRVFRDGGWHCRYELQQRLGCHQNISPGLQDLVRIGDLKRSKVKRKHPVQNRMVWYYRAI